VRGAAVALLDHAWGHDVDQWAGRHGRWILGACQRRAISLKSVATVTNGLGTAAATSARVNLVPRGSASAAAAGRMPRRIIATQSSGERSAGASRRGRSVRSCGRVLVQPAADRRGLAHEEDAVIR
jgi:hypothetical protein